MSETFDLAPLVHDLMFDGNWQFSRSGKRHGMGPARPDLVVAAGQEFAEVSAPGVLFAGMGWSKSVRSDPCRQPARNLPAYG